MSKQKTILKSKKKSKEKLSLKQKLMQHLLQKQLLALRLEEILIMSTFIVGGVIGRTLMQGLPSVEPITFFAVLAGALFGKKKGAVTGAMSWYLSNFLMFGGQGPWTLVHVAAGAVAGYLGGFLNKKTGYIKAILIMIGATLFFEITMNISSGLFFGFGAIVSFMTAIPFMLSHILSNTVFALMIPRTKKFVHEKGRLNERELCKNMLNNLKFWKRGE